MYMRGVVARVVDVCIQHVRCMFETGQSERYLLCECVYVSVLILWGRRRDVRQECGYFNLLGGRER